MLASAFDGGYNGGNDGSGCTGSHSISHQLACGVRVICEDLTRSRANEKHGETEY